MLHFPTCRDLEFLTTRFAHPLGAHSARREDTYLDYDHFRTV